MKESRKIEKWKIKKCLLRHAYLTVETTDLEYWPNYHFHSSSQKLQQPCLIGRTDPGGSLNAEMWKNECKLNEALFQIVCRKDCAQSSSVCFNICAMDAWRSRSSSEEEFNSKEKHNKQILICETRKKLNCLSYCSKYNHNSRSKLAQGNDT